MSRRKIRATWKKTSCSTTVRPLPPVLPSTTPEGLRLLLWSLDPCLAEIEELEEEEVHLACELTVMTPYASNQEDDEKAASWRLTSVPAALQKELDDYKTFRTSPLNRSRDGTACIDIVRFHTSSLPPLSTPPSPYTIS